MCPMIWDGIDHPVEISPGGGDLRYRSVPAAMAGGEFAIASSGFVDSAVPQVGGRQISYARVFATQPTIGAAAGWLLRQAIRVPLKAYRRRENDDRVRLRAGDHPIATAITTPWEGASQYSLVAALLGSMLVQGNALAEVDEGAAGALMLSPTDWRFALPIMPWRDAISGWNLNYDDPTVERTRSADDVLHVAWWSPYGPLGVSPLRQLGVTLQIEDAAQRHQVAMLANGARPPSAITASEQFLGLDPKDRQEMLANLRADLTVLYAGPENSGRPALLPPGLDWKAVGHTAVEAELIDQRIVARAEAGSVYGVAPGVLGHLEHGSTSLPEQRTMSYMDGLAPPLLLIEQTINAQIVRRLLREEDVYVEFDFGAVLRGDPLKEVEAIREAIGTGVMTPNEGRALRNMPRSDLPGTDDLFLPRNNLWPLSIPYPDKGMGGEATVTSPPPAAASDVAPPDPTPADPEAANPDA